jgi:hypothetical protein
MIAKSCSSPRTVIELLFIAEQLMNSDGRDIDEEVIPSLAFELRAVYGMSWMHNCYRQMVAGAIEVLARKAGAGQQEVCEARRPLDVV